MLEATAGDLYVPNTCRYVPLDIPMCRYRRYECGNQAKTPFLFAVSFAYVPLLVQVNLPDFAPVFLD